MDRRDFIKKSLLTLALGGAAPSLLSKSALAAQSKDKILVVVNLFGGNDQLNTLVPFKTTSTTGCDPISPSSAKVCWIWGKTVRT